MGGVVLLGLALWGAYSLLSSPEKPANTALSTQSSVGSAPRGVGKSLVDLQDAFPLLQNPPYEQSTEGDGSVSWAVDRQIRPLQKGQKGKMFWVAVTGPEANVSGVIAYGLINKRDEIASGAAIILIAKTASLFTGDSDAASIEWVRSNWQRGVDRKVGGGITVSLTTMATSDGAMVVLNVGRM